MSAREEKGHFALDVRFTARALDRSYFTTQVEPPPSPSPGLPGAGDEDYERLLTV